jgi:hypothetical protein
VFCVLYFLLHDSTTWPKHVSGHKLRIVVHELLCTVIALLWDCLEVRGASRSVCDVLKFGTQMAKVPEWKSEERSEYFKEGVWSN